MCVLYYVYVCILYYACVCMYTMYVVVLYAYVYTTQHARILSSSLCLRSVCVGVPVLVYCVYVVSMVVAMGLLAARM